MEYTVVFDVVQSGYREWPFPIIGLILVGVTGWFFSAQRNLSKQLHVAPARKWFWFALAWTFIAFTSTFWDYLRLSWALRSGRCQVVEGVVTNFHPSPYGARGGDWFTVDDKRFDYADNIATAGFHQTEANGGPVHQGLPVRIHHVGNEIARLEVAQ